MAKKKKDNIDFEEERYGLFMSDNSYDLDVMYGREYLKTDSPFYVTYYKINQIKSRVDDLYGEAKPSDKKFFPPIKLNVMIDIEDGEMKWLSDTGIGRDDVGTLVFGIFEEELKEKQLEITLGDYVSYNVSGQRERFFEISKADYVADESSKTRGGFRSSYWRKVEATPVKEDVVPDIMN
jgi:hypothetical protein